MYKISKSEFKKVYPVLTAEYFDHTFSYSVLEGRVDGDIFVDCVTRPKTVLVRIFNGLYHLFGEVIKEGELYNWFENEKKSSQKPIVLFVSPDWNKTLDEWDLYKVKNERRTFQFNKEKFEDLKELKISEGYQVVPTTTDLINKSEAFPEQFYKTYWMDIKNFCNHGVSYCIVNDQGRIVSEAVSPAVSEHTIDIDIVTHEDFRGLGLGKVVASHLIDHAVKVNAKVDWTCDYDNTASIKLAESLGFEEGQGHSIYVLK